MALYDRRGKVRLFVENKFWAPLTPNQSVAYLRALPDDGMLAFIAPKDRIYSLWFELREQCKRENLSVVDETGLGDLQRMQVDQRTLLLTHWRRVLDALGHAATAGGYASTFQDIDQLRGLTERMNSGVFLPLRGDEPTDTCVARRLLNYGSLIDDITKRLIEAGVADTKGLAAAGWGRYVRVHDKFVVYLCLHLEAWRDFGMTPLWCEVPSDAGVSLRRIEERFDGARVDDKGGLRIPIRLEVGVERDRVVEAAVHRVRSLAGVLEASPELG